MSLNFETLLRAGNSLIKYSRTDSKKTKGDNSEDSGPGDEYNKLIEKLSEILKTTLSQIFEPIVELSKWLKQLWKYAEDLLAETRRIVGKCETLKSEIRSLVNMCCSMLEDVHLYLESIKSLASVCSSEEISKVNRALRIRNVQRFLWFVEDFLSALGYVQHYNKKVMVSVAKTRNAAELGKETCERERSKSIRQKEEVEGIGVAAAGTSTLAFVAVSTLTGGIGTVLGAVGMVIGGLSGAVTVAAVIETNELNKAIQRFSAMIGPFNEILTITKETSILIDSVQEKARELERDVERARCWRSRNCFDEVQRILIAVGTKADELTKAATGSIAEVKEKKLQLRRM